MRLCTFEKDGRELWGFVVRHPAYDADWVFLPEALDRVFAQSALPSSGWYRSMPAFAPAGGWPASLDAFLGLGDEGMALLSRMQGFTLSFLKENDAYFASQAGFPLAQVRLRAPIPRPRLMFGLVQNSPSFWRHNPGKRITNFFPQGHQRPIGSVIGHQEIFLDGAGFNVELGVVIGKGGKNIPVEEAVSHVAGYTVVIDSQINDYYPDFLPGWNSKVDIEKELDWYVAATCSWCGKKSDAHCVVGPWIVTRDEVGNPYDLLVYTKQNGMLRDRSHTAGTSQGVERTIHWLSGFMTLFPGDIIHMGTVGTDGLPVTPEMAFPRGNTIDSEIERIGTVSAYVLDKKRCDWLTPEEREPNARFNPRDEAIRQSLVPAVKDYLAAGLEALPGIGGWSLGLVRHFWTCYGNYRLAEQQEGMKPTPLPRFLNGPNSALALSGSTVVLAPRATRVEAGVELAFVVGRLASKVRREDAADYILGYAPMITLADQSFLEQVVEPATGQERNLPKVYARWGDGYNILGRIVPGPAPAAGRMRFSAGTAGEAQGDVDEYIASAAQVLEAITVHITLFPGDVVTLGRTAQRVMLAPEADHVALSASIEHIGEVSAALCRG